MSASEQVSHVCLPLSFISEYGPTIGADGVGIALMLLARADARGISRGSYRIFMRGLDMTQHRVRKALFALESCGIVSVERRLKAEMRFYLREPLHQPKITRLDARRGRAAAAR